MSRLIRVTLNDTLIAESNQTKSIEGNYYFPPDSIVKEHYVSSDTISHCSWKGKANYYTICGEKDVAWYYSDPLEKAKDIKGYVAFYKGKVDIEETAATS
ncbi:uncharacterized protein MELLADRAFT_32386 [Melampsora larici-populina 98AG31]|uniref:DUF427 domain-containing protein n=1 Tax=Melampsora larici-populina (strain 98AG31 / pathotype 3-4-7) TaxID=747676 RepID=F4R3P0_MELLP|nr:uncharacterized protein MELLADRAFT_32386 [Melampsora larici-populina 98AG31]EGG12661.1 hypothetical protein MELLADRAFT_32386 [Melampsora larici-populina 98AG31]